MTATKQILSPVLRAASIHVRSSILPASLYQSSTAAHFASAAPGGKAVLPDLPYDYAALSPVISAETMELHHSKHHNAYVTNLNIALEKLDAATSAGDVSAIIALQGALKFNGGGHLNHSLFWENLCSKGSTFPTSGPLADAMVARFCTVDNMKKEISAMCVGVQGSGWGWLGYNQSTGEMRTCCVVQYWRLWQYLPLCTTRSATKKFPIPTFLSDTPVLLHNRTHRACDLRQSGPPKGNDWTCTSSGN